jgi:hypothetical protein
MPRKTTRLYYGLHPETGKPLYWTLKVKNATKPVTIQGNLACAEDAKPGLSFGCFLHNVAAAHKPQFPHRALFISFTKSVAIVVTDISGGKPTKCVRYRHRYGRYVDMNDRGLLTKAAIKKHPELFDRPFTLGSYKPGEGHWKPEYGREEQGTNKFKMAIGELARMKAAGLINLPND